MRKRRLIVTIVLIAVLTAALPAVVMADTGPKPSVVVSFTGAGDEEFYGTLLSKNDSSGPAHVWDGKEETTEHRRVQTAAVGLCRGVYVFVGRVVL